jgi:hypothetical protein
VAATAESLSCCFDADSAAAVARRAAKIWVISSESLSSFSEMDGLEFMMVVVGGLCVVRAVVRCYVCA